MAGNLRSLSPDNEVIDLLADETSNQIAVASTGVAYGKYFALPRNCTFGLDVKMGSSGSVDVKIDLEQGSVPPTTDGSADTTNYGVGDDISSGITDKIAHILAVVPVPTKFARFKFTGQGANAASTYVERLGLVLTRNR